jgi:predicted DNA-binding protein with PD1-like motif
MLQGLTKMAAKDEAFLHLSASFGNRNEAIIGGFLFCIND